ncbi:MAG: DUF2029 domain-containing protein [Acidobacteria bacterium]|nr:DUF2029 domain-containing protein [Acidobacteriota bacterium]
MLALQSSRRTRASDERVSHSGLRGDAALYGLSALFALVLGWTSTQVAQWHWGYLAAGPYALAALVALTLARLKPRRSTMIRMILLGLVILGSVIIPLGLETRWRHQDPAMGFAQPEVSVIERSATYVSKGKDPYRTYYHDGHLVDVLPGLPAYESFFPYFPLMSVFGLPSADTHLGAGLTDARIVMTLMTLVTSSAALLLLKASRERKIRVAQVLLALPTGALFLSTGGDDMPILALLLLAIAFLERRSSNSAGVTLGIAAAMKLTAWPFAVGALLVAKNKKGRSTWLTVALWTAAIVLVTVVPFALHAPFAFFSNVFAFPLGLAGVASPAASALPGHILTTWWAPFGHILAPLTLLVGGYYLAKYAKRHWPLTLSKLLAILSVAFTVMICVASATRVGYVIYPINFAVWSWVTREPEGAELAVA